MADSNFLTMLGKGVDAAKSGNRLLAKLHLLKANDLNQEAPEGLLWLAWVAETPRDAVKHLETLLRRQPNHKLAQFALCWQKMMEKFDPKHADFGAEIESFAANGVDLPKMPNPSGQGSMNQPAKGSTSDTKDYLAVIPPSPSPEPFETNRQEYEVAEAAVELAEMARKPAIESQIQRQPHVDLSDVGGDGLDGRTISFQSFAPEAASLDVDNTTEEVRGEKQDQETSSSENQSVVSEAAALDSDSSSAETPFAEATASETTSEETSDAPGAVEAFAPFAGKSPFGPWNSESTAGSEKSETNGDNSGSGEEGESSEEASSPIDQRPIVLVVDDSPTVRKLVTMTLGIQYRVENAGNGYEAIQKLTEITPDLVLTDINMPRVDGYQLCKLVRKHPATRNIPVIMLSGKDGLFDKLRGKFVGCSGYVTKPFDAKELLAKIESYLPVTSK